MYKVLLLENNNPLREVLSGFLVNRFGTENLIVEKSEKKIAGINDYDLIVIMAHENGEEPASIDALEKFYQVDWNSKKEKTPKFLFLSWFDPLKDIDEYEDYFTPKNDRYLIMDTNNCHILQLPVSETQLNNSICTLLQLR